MSGHCDYIDDEAVLVKVCHSGDLGVFPWLVQRYQRLLLNIAFRLTAIVVNNSRNSHQQSRQRQGDRRSSRWNYSSCKPGWRRFTD